MGYGSANQWKPQLAKGPWYAGVLANVLISDWLVTLLLIGLLLCLTYLSVRKSLKLHHAELMARADTHDLTDTPAVRPAPRMSLSLPGRNVPGYRSAHLGSGPCVVVLPG